MYKILCGVYKFKNYSHFGWCFWSWFRETYQQLHPGDFYTILLFCSFEMKVSGDVLLFFKELCTFQHQNLGPKIHFYRCLKNKIDKKPQKTS